MERLHLLSYKLFLGWYWVRYHVIRLLLGIRGVILLVERSPGPLVSKILKQNGAKIGPNVNFKGCLRIDNVIGDQDSKHDFSNLEIEKNCYIGRDVFFDLPDRIRIGNHCAISAGVMFISHADAGDRPISAHYPRKKGGISVGAGSWIGVNVTILPGITIGNGCVIAAGSVVTKSFPDFSVIGGVPAKVLKTIPAFDLPS